jgi:ABC-type transporter Mla subunit MlaD
VRDWWRRTLARELTRLRKDGRAAVLWSLRITVAAVASYVVGTLFFPGTQPLLAPLTAMLVVQVTPVSLLATGLDRVVAVVTGVSLAVVFGSTVPLRWWSLGVLILVCITIGQVLRLRANLIEVAISAMLVLGVGSLGAEAAAWQRIAETLVGASVGIAANLLFPPKVASADAGRAIDGLADSLSELLNRAADDLAATVSDGRDVAAATRGWLDDARRITHDIPAVGAALLQAEQGRRLNVRAVATPDLGPGLRQGLEALEHSAVAIRVMFRALVDATHDARWLDDDGAADVLLGLAQTFRELAAGVDAFGQLVRDEADPSKRLTTADVQALREALEGMHEARARLDELLLASTDPDLLELHAAMLSTVKRLLREMDLDERVRRQLRLLGPVRPRLTYPGVVRPRSRSPAGSASSADDVTPDQEETQLLPQLRGPRRRRRRRRRRR